MFNMYRTQQIGRIVAHQKMRKKGIEPGFTDKISIKLGSGGELEKLGQGGGKC